MAGSRPDVSREADSEINEPDAALRTTADGSVPNGSLDGRPDESTASDVSVTESERDVQLALERALNAESDVRSANRPDPLAEQTRDETDVAIDDVESSALSEPTPISQPTTEDTDSRPDTGAGSTKARTDVEAAPDSVAEGSDAVDTETPGWRGVAGRLLGRARRVFGGGDVPDAKPPARRRTRKSGDPATSTPRPARKRSATAKPRAPRKAATAKPRGLWGRLLVGVGLAAPEKPKAKRSRKPSTARSAPRKPRTRKPTKQTVPTGLLARTLARFGFGGAADTAPAGETPTPSGDAPVRKKRAASKRRSAPRKPASPRAKAPAKPSESAWRRALRRVLGRS